LEGRRLTSGAVRGLTGLVEFQDVQTTVTQADINDLLNARTSRATATSAQRANISGSFRPANWTTQTMSWAPSG
jgi:hypothetical protein